MMFAALTTILGYATASPVSLGLTLGGWEVVNPAPSITVFAPQVGLAFHWKKLEIDVSDHIFLTIAGPDHFYGLEFRARLPIGEKSFRPFVSPGVGVYHGGPVVALPVVLLEGGVLWESESGFWMQGGLEAMGSLRALGGGPRLSLGWTL